jgi:hypothetical protein
VEEVEYEVVLRAELPVTSELKATSKAVCVVDSLRDSGAPAQELLHRNQHLKNIFLFNGFRPAALNPLDALFPICTSRYALPKSSDTS